MDITWTVNDTVHRFYTNYAFTYQGKNRRNWCNYSIGVHEALGIYSRIFLVFIGDGFDIVANSEIRCLYYTILYYTILYYTILY